jgi:hypothetical protein
VGATERYAQLLGKRSHGWAVDKLGFLQNYAQGIIEGGLKGGMLRRQIQHANGGGKHRRGEQRVGR